MYLRHESIAEGVQPQSSCSLRPATPAWHWSWRPGLPVSLPLPITPKLTGSRSRDCIICRMYVLLGVQLAATVAVLSGYVSVRTGLICPR